MSRSMKMATVTARATELIIMPTIHFRRSAFRLAISDVQDGYVGLGGEVLVGAFQSGQSFVRSSH